MALSILSDCPRVTVCRGKTTQPRFDAQSRKPIKSTDQSRHAFQFDCAWFNATDLLVTTHTQKELAAKWRVSVRTIERMRAPNGPLRWMRVGGGIRFTQEHIDEYTRDGERLQSELQRLERSKRSTPSESSPAQIQAAKQRGQEIARKVAAREDAKAAGRSPRRMSPEERGREIARLADEHDQRKEAKRALRKQLRHYRFKAPPS